MKRQNVLNNQKKVGLYSDETYDTAWSIIDETDKSEQGTGYNDPDNMGGYNFQNGTSNITDNEWYMRVFFDLFGHATTYIVTDGFTNLK